MLWWQELYLLFMNSNNKVWQNCKSVSKYSVNVEKLHGEFHQEGLQRRNRNWDAWHVTHKLCTRRKSLVWKANAWTVTWRHSSVAFLCETNDDTGWRGETCREGQGGREEMRTREKTKVESFFFYSRRDGLNAHVKELAAVKVEMKRRWDMLVLSR